jgi:hypothetical protein
MTVMLHFILAAIAIIAPILIGAFLTRSLRTVLYSIAGFFMGGVLAFPVVFLLTSYPLESSLGSPIPAFYFAGVYYYSGIWPVELAALTGMVAGAGLGFCRTARLRRQST